MKILSAANFNRARNFVKTKARPVDAALFEYTFENGKPDTVWDALSTFVNEDGGFGHGVEPDCRLPDSSVLATSTAFPYLIQTDAPVDHPLVKNGIQYLLRTYDKNLKGWRRLLPEMNNHSRAAWWNYDPKTAETDVIDHWSNPSACAVAYLHRYHELVPDGFLQEVTDKAMSVFAEKKEAIEGHDYLPFIELAEALPFEMSNLLGQSLDLAEVVEPILQAMADHMGMVRGTLDAPPDRGRARTIGAPPRLLTPQRLWAAYKTLEENKVRGASSQRKLADIVSLVRFALHQDDELVPYAEQVQVRFERWMKMQENLGRQFTREQRRWLEMIRDHVAQSLEMTVSDFNFTPFIGVGGLGKAQQVFGTELKTLIDELNGVLVA